MCSGHPDRPAWARGLCSSCYSRERRAGRIPTRPTPPERFWAKVEKTETCWLWTAGLVDGYGRFRDNGLWLAHRWAYIHLVGPIPEGLEPDHLCRVRNCVRPAHLELVTRRENWARGDAPSVANSLKTHCIHGHEFNAENTRIRGDGNRDCRTCAKARTKAWKAAHPIGPLMAFIIAW